MWLISTESHFSAAHQLRGYQGECGGVHGHNFKVRVTVETNKLESVGFGVDFRELKLTLQNLTNKLDHKNLNELPEFKNVNPTAENIAKLIWEDLKRKIRDSIPKEKVKLKEVRVWESDTNSVAYSD